VLWGDNLNGTADFRLRENINLSDLRHANDAKNMDESIREVLDTILETHRALKTKIQIRTDTVSTSRMATEQEIVAASSEMVEEMRTMESSENEKARWLLLESLRFPEMDDRYETISEAEMNTFGWIFDDMPSTGRSWSSLSNWLRRSGGIYWISGKAGSGKSTLMRYIYEHPKTQEYLSLWAGDPPLHLAGFFFWNSGALQQRTQAGLLRTLLYQILGKNKDLLPEVMPEQWKKTYERSLWASDATNHIFTSNIWSVTQLQKSLALLIRRTVGALNIGLFIDGLDEHDRDHKSLILFLENLALSDNVKILTSSRPLVEFEEAFSDGPTLRLQDLTYRDIKIYVDTRLRRDKNFLSFYRKEPKRTSALVTEIVDSAEGVFLWVRLVVDSLLEGITYRDRLRDLKSRLWALPKDLEGMFQHMLDQVHSDYYVHSSQIFQLVRTHLELNERSERRGGTRGRIYALLLSFAQEEDENIISGPPKILSQTKLSDRCDEILTWLKSRCAGLLEARNLASRAFSIGSREHVGNTGKDMDAWPDPPWVVSYIHRSARDFLEQDHIWTRVTNPTAHTGFHHLHAWTKVWILYLKRIKPTSRIQKPYGTSLARIAVEAAEKDATPLSTWCSSPYGEEVESRMVAMHKLEILKAMAFWLIDSETFQSQKFGPYARFTACCYKYPAPGLQEQYRRSAYPRQAIDTRERRCIHCMKPV
jgi:hypothetical protein